MDEAILGKYVHEKIPSNYLELRPNGICFVNEGSSGVTGSYKLQGSDLTIYTGQTTSQARIENGVITDAEGDKWIRSKTWLDDLIDRDLPWELFEAIFCAAVLIIMLIVR